jgi:glucose/arabinose dehydrogenase
VAVVAEGLDRPTQVSDGPDGSLVVAQVGPQEDRQEGSILVLDPATGNRRVLFEDLDKPTGVLWQDGVLWVMLRQSLLRTDWTRADAEPGPLEVVLDRLPHNTRSEGTLTGLADGRLLYETSAHVEAIEPEVVVTEGSATIWVFDPATGTSTPAAVGSANGYAHTVLADGRIASTEVSDEYVGTPPLDEVNVFALDSGADLGWFDCPDREPCARDGVTLPVALFPEGSTPTGIAALGDDLYVTLFVTQQLVRLPLAGWQPGAAVEPEVVVEGLRLPHTVLARTDGSLLVTEYGADRIVQITP